MIPRFGERLLYCDHVEGAGQLLFDFVCRRDLEGIVAKKCIMVEDQEQGLFSVEWSRRIIGA